MSNNEKGKKINEIAKIVNWDSKRVMGKLNEMGIYPKSLESEITPEQTEAFFKRINFTQRSAVQNSAEDKSKASVKKTQNTGRGSGVIVRRVVVESSESEQESRGSRSNNRHRNDSASSGLMSGFSTVRKGDTYEELLKDAKKNNASRKSSDDKADEPPETTADPLPAPRKIRRIKSTGTAETKTEISDSAKQEAGEADLRKAASETDEPMQKSEEKQLEKTKQEDIAQKNNEPVVTVAKPDTAGSVKLGGSVSVETIELSGSSSEVKNESRTARPQSNQENREFRRGNDQRGARNDRQGSYGEHRDNGAGGYGDRNGMRNERGDRPARTQGERGENRNDRYVSGAREERRAAGRDNGGMRQGSGRPEQRQKPKAGLAIPAVDPAITQSQDTRREKPAQDRSSFKKEQQRKEAPRANNQPQKDKYKSAQRFIGDKKGVSEILSDDFSYSGDYDIEHNPAKRSPKPKKNKNMKQTVGAPAVIATLTNIKVPPVITVKELAETMKKTATDVIKKLMLMGVMATLNQEIDFDTAALIASEFGITAEPEIIVTDEELLLEDPDDNEIAADAVSRPPVVVVMGHVDHGKTSLLDAIRSTSVTAGEAGGITQHIGAYMVTVNGRRITFLDTPGHEAFTAMRARGAQVTDVAIIVVAADDGVMPQTIEAINHAKAAEVSIVVAVNKIDKEGANIDRVMNEMAEQGVVAEAWGGDIPFIPVSAKKGENIEELLETVLLSADILELKASPSKQTRGTVIEAKLDKNRGPVATLLVQRGTLRSGDAILSETTFGHIRTMTDDRGNPIKAAGPSTPVEITGLPEVPEAGKVFYVVNKDEKLAKKVADSRRNALRAETMAYSSKVNLEDLFSQIQSGNVKDLNIIVKADVRGSVEAIKQSLEKLGNDEVRVRIIHGGVGGVTESDISLAEASNAIIIGFNVRPIGNVADIAEQKGVDVKLYRVIYDAINDVKSAMIGMLEPEYKEVIMGHIEIRKTFKVSGVGTIAGGYVINGKVVRNSEVRIVRDGIVVHEGRLASLKRFKDDVKEVAQGFECGLSFERYDDIKEGDVVESFVMEEIARSALNDKK